MVNNFFTKSTLARLTLARASQINTIQDLLVAGFDKLPDPDRFKERNLEYIADTGAVDAYVVTYPQPAPTAYAVGMTIKTVVSAANTGACTINVNSLGAKNILLADGSTPSAGVLATGRVHTLIYDGTAFRLQATVTTVTPDDGTVGVAKLASSIYASQAQAEAGVENTLLMTALRTKQAIEALASAIDIQEFTGSGTWNKPPSGTVIEVYCIGGGGGGGSGGRAAAGVNRVGGGGGGFGGFSFRSLAIGDASSSETVTIGASGAGGASQTSDSSPGNAGSDGGDTTFGSLVGAEGGSGGLAGIVSGGTNIAAVQGGSGSISGSATSDAGRGYAGSLSSIQDSPAAGSHFARNVANNDTFFGGLGHGSGGGGVNSSNSDGSGGSADYVGAAGTLTLVPGGAAGGSNGTDGTLLGKLQGSGGSGGGGNSAGAGGSGGTGARGCGGGGGGGCVNGNDSGAGGAGGAGYCLVITY